MMKRARPFLLAALAIGCEASAPSSPVSLGTLFDVAASFGTEHRFAAGGSKFFPGGIPSDGFVESPGADGQKMKLRVNYAVSEGKPATYVTTELWANYPAIWLQPMYVLVTRYDASGPTRLLDTRTSPPSFAPAIFGIGPDSAFYSPFWRVFYVVVPEGTPPDKYRSGRQIFEDNLSIHEGPGRLCALAPSAEAIPAGTTKSFFDDLSVEVGAVPAGSGWVEGREVAVFDFGSDRFQWNEQLEIQEQPLFVFTVRQGDGSDAPVGAPHVGGVGPLFMPRVALAPGGRPIFGSLWRLYPVRVPTKTENPDVGIFIPGPGFAAARARFAPHFEIPIIPDAVTAKGLNSEHAFKIALDGKTCFTDPAVFPNCRWLDSQERLERELPARIERSEIQVTCPFLTYGGKPVP